MQGVANLRTINAQSSYDYLVSQIKNPKNHQILGWQVAVTEKGQDSNQAGASTENSAYILQLSNKDENGNDVLTQFYKDNGIDPKNVDQTKLEVKTVDEEYERIARKNFNDTVGKAFIRGNIETQIGDMLNPFSNHQHAEDNFKWATYQLSGELNAYLDFFGAGDSYYKELTEKLDTIDPDHKNSAVSYIKSLINTSASGQRIEYDDKQAKVAGQAFDDCFGGLSLADAKVKGAETSKAFNKALGQSSIEKYFGILLKSKSIKEITDDFIKELNLSKKEDTPKKAESQSDIGMLINQKTSQASEEKNDQMETLKRQLNRMPAGTAVDVEI
jgi:hypothetical protein